MRYAGFGLFVIGLTVASWYAAYVPEGIGAERIGNWFSAVGIQFLAGWVTMIVGVVVARAAAKKDTPADEAANANSADTAGEAIQQMRLIARRIDDIAGRDLAPADVAQAPRKLADELDHLLTEEIPVFLDARPLLIDRFGLETFAELIGHFAVMERAAARAWSAITDEAWDEVPPSLTKAQAAVHRSLDVLDAAAPSAAA